MYPEAGGSSSFARRAFNEFWSFFAAWAQMLTYVATIATSAFFVPHYLGGLFWEALRHSPGDIMFTVVSDRDPGRDQHRRRQGVDRGQHAARGDRLRHPGAAGGGRGDPRVLAARSLIDNIHLGRRADVDELRAGDPDRHARLHGHRDRLEHVRGGQGRGDDDPGGDRPRAARRVRHLLHAAGRGAVGAAGRTRPPTAPIRRCWACPDEQGGYAGDPVLGRRQRAAPRPAAAAGGDLRRPARGHDPLPGHERRADRHLAPRLLDGHPPPDARRAAAPAPALPHAVDRDHRVQRLRHPGDAAGRGEVPGQRVLVRRAAVVHDGARLGRRACGSRSPTSRAPTRAPGT